ncbi:MAG: porin family protein [Saprospiraceae bacterium]
MRKLIIFCFFVFPTFLSAQLELGFRAGLNMSEATDLRATNGDLVKAAQLNGVNAGIFANIQLGSIMALQPEVTFSQKGFTATWDSSDSSSTLNTSYLDMPLMIEAGFAMGKNFRVFANAGPNVSYLIKAEEEFYNSMNGETTTTEYNFDVESLERLDVGINFGGGISFRTNRWKYTLDARYNMGLKEIMVTEDAMDFVENAKHRVTNISIGISYFVFGGAKKMINTTKEAGKYY